MSPDLPEGWILPLLGDLLVSRKDLTYGIVQPGTPTPGGVPIIRVKDIRDGRVDTSDPLQVSSGVEASYERSRLRGSELLVTLVGTVGEVAVAGPELAGWNVARAVGVVRVRPEIGARWVAWSFGLDGVLNRMAERVNTTVQTTLNLADLRELPVPLPPDAERERIAAILGALDDKIESNRRIQDQVLDLAEAAYLESCASHSNSVPLKRVGRWLSGGTPRTSTDEYWGGDLPWISAASLKTFYVRGSDRNLTPAGAEVATNVVPAGTILLVVRGMSLKSEFRFGVTQREVAFGQDCKAILPKIDAAVLAVALRANTSLILDLVDEAGHGTGRLMTDRLEQFLIEVPTNPEFARLADSLLTRGALAATENDVLTNLRDTLLPELLSGRIRVPDAEEAVA